VTLSRDDAGLANWQWTDPGFPDDTFLPLVYRLAARWCAADQDQVQPT